MNFSTNRQACSRDIGKLYAKHQILKYVINGGSWGDNHRYCRVSMLKLLHFHCLQYTAISINPLSRIVPQCTLLYYFTLMPDDFTQEEERAAA